MRIIFMGTPDIAVPTLEHIIRSGHSVEAVFTQPDRPVGRHQELTPPPIKRVATAYGIPAHQPAKVKTDEVRDLFNSLTPDIAVVVAYGRILPQWLLDIPRWGCVNVHFSLLPKYRGAAPVNWAIVQGETESGVTTMQIDAGLDTGPILLQTSCSIGSDETAPELAGRLAIIGAELLVETLSLIERGAITHRSQDHSQATLAPMLKREDGLIDWNLSAQHIRHRIRGFQPWPGAWTVFNRQRLILWGATAISDNQPSDENLAQSGPVTLPGTIMQAAKDYLVIRCGHRSLLQIEELQLEGKRRMNTRDFLNGIRLDAGTRLGQ
jgi:methionyl-tRNA formyltransferase